MSDSLQAERFCPVFDGNTESFCMERNFVNGSNLTVDGGTSTSRSVNV